MPDTSLEEISPDAAEPVLTEEQIEQLRPYDTKEEVSAGDDHLTAITTENNQNGTRARIETPALFSFIGATPCTEWLRQGDDSAAPVALSENGFVLIGRTLPPSATDGGDGRPAHFLETSQPGVFAAGDVRSGSVKRVASAVGEGSMSVKPVHGFFDQIPQR